MPNFYCKTYYYYCSDCKEAWTDKWECSCDSTCPKCDKYYTPFNTKREWLKAQTPNSIKFIKEKAHGR